MAQRRKILLSVVLTLVLVLSAITIRSVFIDAPPVEGETIQVVTSTAPADTGYGDSSKDHNDDHDHDNDYNHDDHDNDNDHGDSSSYADHHADDDHDD